MSEWSCWLIRGGRFVGGWLAQPGWCAPCIRCQGTPWGPQTASFCLPHQPKGSFQVRLASPVELPGVTSFLLNLQGYLQFFPCRRVLLGPACWRGEQPRAQTGKKQ